MENKQEKQITQQWLKYDVFKAMEKCAKYRPDLQIHVSNVEESDDGLMVRAKIHINGGRTLFAQRLTNFIVTSLLEHHEAFTAIDEN
jgi:hypothetical protein